MLVSRLVETVFPARLGTGLRWLVGSSWVTNLGANVTWTLPVEGVDLKARLSVYNLLNSETEINVHSRYESAPGVKMPYFGQARAWQAPRYMNLVITYNF